MKVVLVCSAGMSTSMLIDKMIASAKERKIQLDVKAVAEAQLKNELEELDIILIGPQVRYLEKKIKVLVEPKGIKVDIIDQLAYGLIQGDKVLDQAIKLIGI